MGILTPTFGDAQKTGGEAALRVVEPHEPVRGDDWQAAGEFTAWPATSSTEEGASEPTPIPVPEKPPLKIAMIGTAPSSRMLAPYNDPTWKIWSCSPGNMNQIPRFDVWFEMHSNLHWPEHEAYGPPYLKWLNEGSFPVVMQDQKFVARATTYPLLDMVELFQDQDNFTSSFAYMMALAISQGCTEMGLYGIDMASRDEYLVQRPGGRYFINAARRRGIKVTIPPESDLDIPTPLYGYMDSTLMGRKLAARKTEIKGRVAPMEAQISQFSQNVTYLKGAMEDVDYFETIQLGNENDRILMRSKLERLEKENADLRSKIGAVA